MEQQTWKFDFCLWYVGIKALLVWSLAWLKYPFTNILSTGSKLPTCRNPVQTLPKLIFSFVISSNYSFVLMITILWAPHFGILRITYRHKGDGFLVCYHKYWLIYIVLWACFGSGITLTKFVGVIVLFFSRSEIFVVSDLFLLAFIEFF